jgi:hypothetical protein
MADLVQLCGPVRELEADHCLRELAKLLLLPSACSNVSMSTSNNMTTDKQQIKTKQITHRGRSFGLYRVVAHELIQAHLIVVEEALKHTKADDSTG